MRFRILGQLEVDADDGAVSVGAMKSRAVLAMLLLHANEAVSPERLALALWGENVRGDAVKTVRVYISRLRKALGEEDRIVTTAGGYRLCVRLGELDAAQFDALVDEGRRAAVTGDPARAATLLRDALVLWRGPALADFESQPFASTEIARLHEQRLAALEARVAADLAIGRHGELVGELQSLVADHRTHEGLARQLMLALYRNGRQTEALDVYWELRSRLSADLGLEPGPALRALQRAILEQDASLDHVALPERPPQAYDSAASVPLPRALTVARPEAFVGRDAYLRRLDGIFAQTVAGGCRLVVLGGEPGIGKTRLATEFARRVHARSATVLFGRCDEAALLALQPFVEALRHFVDACRPREIGGSSVLLAELRRLLPEVAERLPDLPEPLAGDPEGARARLFEAVSGLLCDEAQRAPLVLILDDLHWADDATILLLRYLMRHPRAARVMVLATYRDTEIDPDHALMKTIAALHADDLVERVAVGALDSSAVSALVGALAGRSVSARLEQLVYQETEGNPFFVAEVMRARAELGGQSGQEPTWTAGGGAVPVGVRDVIRQRVARLGKTTSRVLDAAAVLGSAFDLDVLRSVTELGEDDLVERLEAAMRARLVEESLDARSHAFAHVLIRHTLYGGLTATRRALLHRRAGDAHEVVNAGRLDPHLAEIAYHYTAAGTRRDIEKAIGYSASAGRHALSQLSYERAAAHFRAAAGLMDATSDDAARQRRCELVIAQGEAELQAGDPGSRLTLLAAARLAEELGSAECLARAALANSRGLFSSAEGVDRDRVEILRTALRNYRSGDSSTRAALLAQLAVELVTETDWSLRDKLNEDALAMARRVEDPRTLARVLVQCCGRWRPQMLGEVRADLCEAREIADRLGDRVLLATAAYLGAHAAMEAGDLQEADQLLERLLSVSEQLRQPLLRWYSAIARAKRYSITGAPGEAERLAFAAAHAGRVAGQPDATLWLLVQLFVTRFLRGGLDNGEPHLPSVLAADDATFAVSPGISPSRSTPLMIAAAMSVALYELNRPDAAREHLHALMQDGLADLPQDYTQLAILALASVTAAHLGDRASARRLGTLLEPHRQQFVNGGACWLGSTAHYLGLLAASTQRADEAAARFATAERQYISLGAKAWLVRLRGDRAALATTR